MYSSSSGRCGRRISWKNRRSSNLKHRIMLDALNFHSFIFGLTIPDRTDVTDSNRLWIGRSLSMLVEFWMETSTFINHVQLQAKSLAGLEFRKQYYYTH